MERQPSGPRWWKTVALIRKYILDFCDFSASSSKARSGLFAGTGFFYKLSGLFITNSPDYFCYDFTPRRMRTSSLNFGGLPYISTPTR